MDREAFFCIVLKDSATQSRCMNGRLGEVIDFVAGKRHGFERKIGGRIPNAAADPKPLW
jgi:hypothetical protein